ncbi:hypothetical protein Q4534_06370 [Cyclobacterium sp. 1_MG-2023]|uniref:hypothetical protein n=1 Tax=Cyclobacterium sp. 1_MG-2023 TaxID=3062681 RepID=UPI0026E2034D|nr:hypothetical protein [Cyclobacterium sp. 1_MG-2023]MDO6437020.1 hypothetical protein [Cyclobacterium sp. 1_MG-2023]
MGLSDAYNYASPRNANFITDLVYGTITLTMHEATSVKVGRSNGLLDRYDFDLQEGRTGRNIATWIG